MPQPLGGVEPALDPLGQVDLLLGVEQRDLADLLEVRPDRVGRRGELGVAAGLLERLGLLVVPLEVGAVGLRVGLGRLDQRGRLVDDDLLQLDEREVLVELDVLEHRLVAARPGRLDRRLAARRRRRRSGAPWSAPARRPSSPPCVGALAPSRRPLRRPRRGSSCGSTRGRRRLAGLAGRRFLAGWRRPPALVALAASRRPSRGHLPRVARSTAADRGPGRRVPGAGRRGSSPRLQVRSSFLAWPA